MPVHKVPGGYKWGSKGKVYPTKEQAGNQAKAAYANGYKEKATAKAIRDSYRWDDKK